MLQSSNQYLRPDYLTAPNALDSKSSPLALLAQTCSAIGADTTNPKLLAANIEKATKAHKSLTIDISRDKLSPLSSHSSLSTGSAEQQQIKTNNSSFKPYESNNNYIRLTEMMANNLNNNNNGNMLNNNYQHQNQHQHNNHNNNNTNNNNNNHIEHIEQATNLVTTTTIAAAASATATNLSNNQRVKTPKISVNNINVMMGLGNNATNTGNANTIGNGNGSGNINSSNGILHQNGQADRRCDSNQSATSQRESPSATIPLNGNMRRPSSTSSSNNDFRHTAASPVLQQQHQRQQQQQQQQSYLSRSLSKDSPGLTTISAAALSPNTNHNHSNNNSHTTPSRYSSSLNVNNITSSASASVSASVSSSTSSPSSSSIDKTASTLVAASKEASYVKALHAAAASTTTGNNSNSPANNSSNVAYYQNYAAATGGAMQPYSMDLMAASALMSPHHPLFKAAALNPYLNYARLKGLDMSPNICRDPYCTGCPANPHFLHKAAGQPCPAGCPQCERESMGKAAAVAAAAAGNTNASAAAAAVAASSYHAQLAALAAASQMPYVCSWIGGDTPYCGKRFATSDELFQHLRTHTASLPDSVLSAAAAGGIPPNHPLFSRTYPTPPLSPLSAARYHPYGKPSMLPPSLTPSAAASLAGLQMPPHHALAQYFSPYSLYGPRMGSSHP